MPGVESVGGVALWAPVGGLRCASGNAWGRWRRAAGVPGVPRDRAGVWRWHPVSVFREDPAFVGPRCSPRLPVAPLAPLPPRSDAMPPQVAPSRPAAASCRLRAPASPLWGRGSDGCDGVACGAAGPGVHPHRRRRCVRVRGGRVARWRVPGCVAVPGASPPPMRDRPCAWRVLAVRSRVVRGAGVPPGRHPVRRSRPSVSRRPFLSRAPLRACGGPPALGSQLSPFCQASLAGRAAPAAAPAVCVSNLALHPCPGPGSP